MEARLIRTEINGLDKIHNKGVIVDGHKVLVSSVNWSLNSPLNNREVSLLFDHPDLGSYYTDVFMFATKDTHGYRDGSADFLSFRHYARSSDGGGFSPSGLTGAIASCDASYGLESRQKGSWGACGSLQDPFSHSLPKGMQSKALRVRRIKECADGSLALVRQGLSSVSLLENECALAVGDLQPQGPSSVYPWRPALAKSRAGDGKQENERQLLSPFRLRSDKEGGTTWFHT